MYVPGETVDSIETHAAALAYVDSALPPLFEALARRGGAFCVLCSDHGTAYGEDGYRGHRVACSAVWNVPYAEVMLPAR
jgi:glucan phosphoethanolaminetransferase (alkaline phosphatase superfamily)